MRSLTELAAKLARKLEGCIEMSDTGQFETWDMHGAAVEIHEMVAEYYQEKLGWQPIETAPKDGTEILTWDGQDAKILRWALGRWDDWGEMPGALLPPTHWMPLPEPPK